MDATYAVMHGHKNFLSRIPQKPYLFFTNLIYGFCAEMQVRGKGRYTITIHFYACKNLQTGIQHQNLSKFSMVTIQKNLL